MGTIFTTCCSTIVIFILLMVYLIERKNNYKESLQKRYAEKKIKITIGWVTILYPIGTLVIFMCISDKVVLCRQLRLLSIIIRNLKRKIFHNLEIL